MRYSCHHFFPQWVNILPSQWLPGLQYETNLRQHIQGTFGFGSTSMCSQLLGQLRHLMLESHSIKQMIDSLAEAPRYRIPESVNESLLSLDMLNYIKLAAIQLSLCVCNPSCLPNSQWKRWIGLFCRLDPSTVSGIWLTDFPALINWHLDESWNAEEVQVLVQNHLRWMSHRNSLIGIYEPQHRVPLSRVLFLF